MSSVEPEKWYVVFHEKETGIFPSWPDAEDQVYKFKHNAHKSYRTFTAAQKAWLEFLAKHPEHEANRRTTTCDEGRTSHSSVGGPSNPGNADVSLFVPDDSHEKYILKFNMVAWLAQACRKLGLGPPTYLHPFAETIGGEIFWRMKAYLYTREDGNRKVCTSRYARCVDAAREDVAVQLLRKLESFYNMKICDFNYHNISLGKENEEVDTPVKELQDQFWKTNFGV